MTVDRQPNPFAFWRVDDFQEPVGEWTCYLEWRRGVAMSTFVTCALRVARSRIGAMNAHVHRRESRNVREQFPLELRTKYIGIGYGKHVVDQDRHICVEPVAQPTRFDVEDLFEAGDMLGGVPHLAND